MELTGLSEAVELIQMEYLEMPELRLTFREAQKLWNLSSELCHRALAALVECEYLTQRPDGAYVRRGAPPLSIEAIESLVRAM